MQDDVVDKKKDESPFTEYKNKRTDAFIILVKESKLDEELSISTNRMFVGYFLKAKKWKLEGALELLSNYMKWRREQNIGDLSFEVVKKELLTCKLLVLSHAKDKNGNIIAIFYSRLHLPSQSPSLEFVRMVVFLLETFLCREEEYKGYKIINDMTNVGWSNFDFGILASLQGLQEYFPLMPIKVLILNPPSIFEMVWVVAKPFFYENILQLIELVHPPDLLKYIDADNIPKEWGGNLELDCEKIIAKELASQ